MWHAIAAYPALYISAGAILGLLVGSFLNVVILRLPRRLFFLWEQQCREHLEQLAHTTAASPEAEASPAQESSEAETLAADTHSAAANSNSTDQEAPAAPPGIVFEPSHCMRCKRQLSAWENIPVISYLLLRGRCRSCGVRISPRYPLVELLTAILSATVLWQFGFTGAGLGALLLTWSLIALCGIDWDHHLLPDNITLPLLWLGLIFNLSGTFSSLNDAVIGAVSGYLILWSVFHGFRLLTGKEGMGYGDFKLTAALGAWLGWQLIPVIILAASLSGSIIGLSLILSGRQQSDKPIPFGPYLAIGGFLALLWGDSILTQYFALFQR